MTHDSDRRMLAAVLALAGCASLQQCSTPRSPASAAGRPGARPRTYAFERLPSQQAQAAAAADARRRGAARRSRPPASSPRRRRRGARRQRADRRAHHRHRALAVRRPVLVRRLGPWHRPFGYGRYGRGYWGPYWGPVLEARAGIAAATGTTTGRTTTARSRVLIRDKQQRRAALRGARQQRRLPRPVAIGLLPAMFSAALKDFPDRRPDQPAPGHGRHDHRDGGASATPGRSGADASGWRRRRRGRAGRPRSP